MAPPRVRRSAPSRPSAAKRAKPPTGELRDGFKFRGGRLALDLLATLAARRTTPKELLASPADLGRWLVAAGLATRAPELTAEDVAQARELREALYRLAFAAVHHRPLYAPDRTLLNRWAGLPAPAPQLAADQHITWIGNGVHALLAAIARDAVELLGSPLAARLRACAGDTCAILFLDQSRAGERRWCSMTACGNRAKVLEFRRREARR